MPPSALQLSTVKKNILEDYNLQMTLAGMPFILAASICADVCSVLKLPAITKFIDQVEIEVAVGKLQFALLAAMSYCQRLQPSTTRFFRFFTPGVALYPGVCFVPPISWCPAHCETLKQCGMLSASILAVLPDIMVQLSISPYVIAFS